MESSALLSAELIQKAIWFGGSFFVFFFFWGPYFEKSVFLFLVEVYVEFLMLQNASDIHKKTNL